MGSLMSKRTASQSVVDLVAGTPFYNPPPANAAQLLELYKSSPWVRSIVGKIAANCAKQCWYLEDANGERIDEHPMLDFMKFGTGRIAGKRLSGRKNRQLSHIYLDLAGEAFWVIGRGKDKKPASYAVIPPHWVQSTPSNLQDYYVIYPKNGTALQIPATEVLAFSDPDVKDPYGRGNSLTAAARVELDTDEAASNYIAGFFKNYARPDFIVSGTNEHPIGSEKDRSRLETSWLEKFRGFGKGGRPFFSNRPIEIKEIGNSLKDNSMVDMRTDQRKVISEIYGMPPEILGRLESSNRATIDSADYLMAQHITDPRLSDMCDELQLWGDDEFGLADAGLTLCYETPVQEDIAAKSAIMLQAKQFYTGNEFRQLTGHAPLDELNELPPDPVPFDPFGGPADGGTPPGKPAADDAENPKEDAADDEEPEPAASKAKSGPTTTLSADDIVKISRAHEDPQVRVQAVQIMQQTYEALLRTYGDELLSELESEVRFSINMDVANWLAGRSTWIMGKVDETTSDMLRKALERGAENGEGLEALSARIEQLFEDAAKIRGGILGDTEATALTGYGSQAAAVQGGFTRKVWISSRDQVVRDSHKALDGQTVGTLDEFVAPSGARADHPGGFGEAAEDINCRCAMRPMLEGEKDVGARFERMHARRFDHVSAGVKRAMKSILMAQADVAKAVLVRTLAPLGT